MDPGHCVNSGDVIIGVLKIPGFQGLGWIKQETVRGSIPLSCGELAQCWYNLVSPYQHGTYLCQIVELLAYNPAI
jgi:hypothetical protein